MQDVLRQLQEDIQSRRPVAYTALVETRGSTPQKAGARMLVYPDGSQAGTLGGGCVEAEVKRRALRLLDEGDVELLTFQLDDNYGWDDGLICGGRMKMLVDPIRPDEDVEYFRILDESLAAGTPCTEAVIIDAATAGGGCDGDPFYFTKNQLLLGNLKSDSIHACYDKYLKNPPKPVRLLSEITWGELARKYGDPDNERVYHITDLTGRKWSEAYLRDCIL